MLYQDYLKGVMMKKSYISILIFELVIFIVLILNSFESSILRGFRMVFWLAILVFCFKLMLGYEKRRFRYN